MSRRLLLSNESSCDKESEVRSDRDFFRVLPCRVENAILHRTSERALWYNGAHQIKVCGSRAPREFATYPCNGLKFHAKTTRGLVPQAGEKMPTPPAPQPVRNGKCDCTTPRLSHWWTMMCPVYRQTSTALRDTRLGDSVPCSGCGASDVDAHPGTGSGLVEVEDLEVLRLPSAL